MNALLAFVALGAVAVLLSHYVVVGLLNEPGCQRYRECPVSTVPDPATVLTYVAAGATALVLIMVVLNGVLRLSRTNRGRR